jgi:hypothetical protein
LPNPVADAITPMKHTDFTIGGHFILGGGLFLVTDVGTRTVCAIKLDQGDPSWCNGPPYALAEHVIDENDQPGCLLPDDVRAQSVSFGDGIMTIVIDYGLVIRVPLAGYPRLREASENDLNAVEISRTGLRWDALDEDLSIRGFLKGAHAVSPSPSSFP